MLTELYNKYRDFCEKHQKWLFPVTIIVLAIFVPLIIGWVFFDFSILQLFR